MVLDLQTDSITTQYHVVIDDEFTTVPSLAREEEVSDHWTQLCLEEAWYVHRDDPPPLQDEWLTQAEQRTKIREQQREELR